MWGPDSDSRWSSWRSWAVRVGLCGGPACRALAQPAQLRVCSRACMCVHARVCARACVCARATELAHGAEAKRPSPSHSPCKMYILLSLHVLYICVCVCARARVRYRELVHGVEAEVVVPQPLAV